jgi:hypothetical protein
MKLADAIQELRGSDPSLDYMIRVFEEANTVYEEALVAMGQQVEPVSSPVALTNVAVTFDSDASSGE